MAIISEKEGFSRLIAIHRELIGSVQKLADSHFDSGFYEHAEKSQNVVTETSERIAELIRIYKDCGYGDQS